MMRNCSKSCAALALLALLISPANAQLPTAQLNTIAPLGGRPGATVDVTISGKDLDSPSRLWFSHPGITGAAKESAPNEFLPPRPSANQFTVAIAADVPPGVYDVRVVGKYGASNPQSFVVGTVPDALETEPNNDAATAMSVPLDSVVYGTADGENFDVFKLALKQGQRVIADCQAYRLDTKLDGTLLLLDAKGNELARGRDNVRRDPVIDFTAPADGEYFVKLFDHTYRGGDEYAYRLAVTTGPVIDFAFPPCGVPGTKQRVTLYGRNLPGGSPAEGVAIKGRLLEKLDVEIDVPGDPAAMQSLAVSGLIESEESSVDGFSYRLTTPQGPATPVTIGFATAPLVVEQEPNDDPAAAQKVSLPCEFVGQFYPSGDVDRIAFEAKKGDVYWIEVLAQRLGTTADPYVLIERVTKNDKGEEQVSVVQELDDDKENIGGNNYRRFRTSSGDASYRFAVPEDGTYRVMVRDLYYRNRGNPRFVYRLAIRPERPDFRLAVVSLPDEPQQDQSAVPAAPPLLRKGGAIALEVLAFRRDGFDGEIELSASGLPAGVTAAPSMIGGGETLGVVTLIAEESAADWVGEITITGKAKIGDAELTRTARPGAVVVPAQNGNETSRSRLARSLVLAVTAGETAPAVVRAGEGKMWEMARGGKLQIPVQVTRNGEFKGAINLQADGLPNNLGKPNVNFNADQASANMELAINANAKPAVYSFVLKGQTQWPNYRRNPEAAEAAKKDKEDLEKIAGQVADEAKQAQQKKQDAEKAANEATTAAKQATDAVTAAENELKQTQQQADGAAAAAQKAKDEAAVKTDDQNLASAAANAQKAAEQATAKLQQATEKKTTAMQAATDAATKSQQAAEAKAAADKAATDAAEKSKRAEQAKQATNKAADDLNKAANPKNVNVAIYSTPVMIKIVNSPVTVSFPSPSVAVDQNGMVELPVKIERKYEFNDEVEIVLVGDNARGVSAQSIKLPAGQNEGKLVLKADNGAAAGERTLNVETRCKFNGQNLQDRSEFRVVVNEKKAENK
ncbi:MAG: hypothetical protein WD875_05570 [Pirellulales bacterium]